LDCYYVALPFAIALEVALGYRSVMDAKTFIQTYGWEEAVRVAKAAGTTREYFYQISAGFRNASPPLAQRLVEASEGRLDMMPLMMATEDRKTA
jgi:hypothetical protein